MKVSVIVLLFAVSIFKPSSAEAQSQEAAQLLLNWEKLAQLKSILRNMYKGYQVVSQGYNTIRDISKGNFRLHEVFLDGLLEVSPGVKKYERVADVISYQQKIMEEYRRSFSYFKATGSFTVDEIDHMRKVYSNIFQESLESLDEFFMIITAGKLRMSDDERLESIDRIFADMQEKLIFL